MPSAEDNGKWLIEHCEEDKKMRPDVRSSIADASVALDTIERKLNERKVKLQSELINEEKLQPALDSFIDRFATPEFYISRQKPVSALWEEVAKQQHEQKVIDLIFVFVLLCSGLTL